MSKYLSTTERRQARVRRAVKAGAKGRPRLSVFRSSKHIYAQIIDDLKGGTVVAASSTEKTVRRMNTKTDHRDFIWYILKQREKKNEVSDNEVIMNAALFM